MSEAGTAADAYHARKASWPGSKFKPGRRVVRETDPTLPGVTFYRYSDGSLSRLGPDGDLEEI